MTDARSDRGQGGAPLIRLLIADVDGTLVTPDKILTRRAIEAVLPVANTTGAKT
jgi:hypothetical protein